MEEQNYIRKAEPVKECANGGTKVLRFWTHAVSFKMKWLQASGHTRSHRNQYWLLKCDFGWLVLENGVDPQHFCSWLHSMEQQCILGVNKKSLLNSEYLNKGILLVPFYGSIKLSAMFTSRNVLNLGLNTMS